MLVLVLIIVRLYISDAFKLNDEIDTDSELGKQLIETCSGLKDKDPNDIQWEKEQMEIQVNEPRRKFEQWWEQNKERILAEDQLNHDMQFKSKFIQNGDY